MPWNAHDRDEFKRAMREALSLIEDRVPRAP